MGTVGRTLGILFLAGAVIFVAQILGVAKEISRLPPAGAVAAPGGGVSLDLRRFGIYDFLFTREAFLLLHLWVVWALVRLAKQRGAAGFGDKIIGSMAVLTLVAGHGIGFWVTSQGPSVGLW